MAVDTKLKQIIAKLRVAEKSAQEDLSGWEARTLPGAQLRKAQAQDDVRTLTAEYKAQLPKHLFRVFVYGDRANDFAAFAEKEGAIVVDGNELYRTLAEGVAKSQDVAAPRFGPHQQWRLASEMTNLAMLRGGGYAVAMLPHVDPSDMDTPTPTFEGLLAKVKRSVRAKNGDALNQMYLESEIIDKAVKMGAATSIIPVIITGLSIEEVQELSKSLFGASPCFDVVAGSDVSNENLIKSINKKIQSVFKTGNKQ